MGLIVCVGALALAGCGDSGGDGGGDDTAVTLGDSTSEPGDDTADTGDDTGDSTSETGDETGDPPLPDAADDPDSTGGGQTGGDDPGPDATTEDLPPGGDDFDPTEFGPLCDPCHDDVDCAADGITTACASYGSDGSFCASLCVDSGDCPEGYVCKSVATAGDADAHSGPWCVRAPTSEKPFAECPCSEAAAAVPLTTVCTSLPEGEGCVGTKRCTIAGLTACAFPGETDETCNGEDDDCDGVIDDGLCDDGDPCTEDSCDAVTGGCSHAGVPDGGACEDGDECTMDDECSQGVCKPGEPRDCDDGTPCTTESCDPASGSCLYEATTGPCNDGEPCTGPDTCEGGHCVAPWLEDCFYTGVPDVPGCEAGSTKPELQDEALARVNEIRALSGVPTIPYDTTSDHQTQAAALMIVANGELSHFPPESWHCYGDDGAIGLEKSNIHIGFWPYEHGYNTPTHIIDTLVKDLGVENLGHRRWILDPFLKHVSYGTVDGVPTTPDFEYDWAQGSALKVIYDEAADISDLDLPFVAYPVGLYPASLFAMAWYLNFSALVDNTNRSANKLVAWENVSIQVTGPDGAPLTITDVSWSNAFVGLQNHVQWKVDALQLNTTYDVTISGATNADGDPLGPWSYDFTLVP